MELRLHGQDSSTPIVGKNNSPTAQHEKHMGRLHFIGQIRIVTSGGSALLNPEFTDLYIRYNKGCTLQEESGSTDLVGEKAEVQSCSC